MLCSIGVTLLSACDSEFLGSPCEDMGFTERLQGVTEIRVFDNEDSLERSATSVITDTAQIREIIQFILDRPDRWHAPLAGVPIGSIRIVFWKGEERWDSVKLAPTFLEAQGCGYFFIRTISEGEANELAAMVHWPSPLSSERH